MAIKVLLTQGYEALIDDEDYALVEKLWRVNGGVRKPYAVTGNPPTLMHHLILPPRDGLVVDHINGNQLDNRRCNLRLVTPSENKTNVSGARSDNKSSGVLGVSGTKEGKWRARIMKDGTSHYVGDFSSIEEAKAVRLQAEKDLHGIQPRRAHLHG